MCAARTLLQSLTHPCYFKQRGPSGSCATKQVDALFTLPISLRDKSESGPCDRVVHPAANIRACPLCPFCSLLLQALGLPEAFQKVAERLVAGEQLLAIMEQIEQQEPAFNGLICIYVL